TATFNLSLHDALPICTLFPNGQNCDIVFNISNPSATTCPSCYMHSIYTEIDGDWNASKVAPTAPPIGQMIDVQGFVYWDADSSKDRKSTRLNSSHVKI